MEDNYRPNSNKYKAEQAAKSEDKKKIGKVIQGTAKTKKKGGFSAFINSFVCDDPSKIRTYLISDVIVPTVKDAILETVRMFLNGGEPSRKSRIRTDRISYGEYYRQRGIEPPRQKESLRPTYSYDDIYLDSRAEAEEVLSRMGDVIEEYDMVSVGDLFEMVGIQGDYTDQKYGWTTISTARVERTRDGYRLDLPKARPLN